MLIQAIRMAWNSIVTNKARSFLTMLGIIVGVIAVTVMVSLVEGVSSRITSEVESLGTSMLSVYVFDDKGAPLKSNDLKELAALSSVSELAPLENSSITVNQENAQVSLMTYSTTPSYFSIRGLTVSRGRLLKNADIQNCSFVAVVSSAAAMRLFGDENVVGKALKLNGYPFKIVGVLPKSQTLFQSEMGGFEVYIPFPTRIRMTGKTNITEVYVSAANDDALATEQEIDAYFYKRFAHDADAYYIDNISTVLETMSVIKTALTILLGGVAAISLFVGGIGIMNIMLVVVSERTKEIGIRKAVGATRKAILVQFLFEAIVLCLSGCAVGVFVSFCILQFATLLAKGLLSFTLSIGTLLIAVGFSCLIGVVFGLRPANKASKLQPVAALRELG